MTRVLRLAVAALATVLAVVACGGGDDTDNPTPVGGGGGSTASLAPAESSVAPSENPGENASSAPSTGGGNAGSSQPPAIIIQNFKYGEPLTVAPGTEIRVTNQDVAKHDVLSDDGLFKTPLLGQGEQATFKAPTKPGEYKFSCSVHPGSMSGIGTLVVK